MKVAVTGSSGLIGTALVAALTESGHTPVRVVRGGSDGAGGTPTISWSPSEGTIDAEGFRGIDAVVHLAGAGIGDKRWSDERKRVILESRTRGTALLASTLAGLDDGPKVLLSGSAIGFYGDRGDEVLTETSAPGPDEDFLSYVCTRWEAAAAPAVDAGIRTCFLRTGVVQTPAGGALGKMAPLFKLGLGGRLGSGEQWFSWISIDDQIGAILHLLDSEVSGPVNLTGPEPVRNATFTKALGRELGRPTILPVPKFAPGLLLGRELAHALLFESQRVHPTVLLDDGYQFQHSTVSECLAAVLAD